MNNKCLGVNSYFLMGPQGPTGPQGEAATIRVNSTTTGEAGTEALVINRGTENNALLDFIIPRGSPGMVPTFEIGNVTTGVPGSNAMVYIRPIQENQK